MLYNFYTTKDCLFENKDQIFESYLTFSDEHLLEKYGTEIQTSDCVYYLSDLDYSTREEIVKCLEKDEYNDIVDLKYRITLFVALFSEAKLTTSSGKQLEKVEKLHTVSLMNKLLTSQ